MSDKIHVPEPQPAAVQLPLGFVLLPALREGAAPHRVHIGHIIGWEEHRHMRKEGEPDLLVTIIHLTSGESLSTSCTMTEVDAHIVTIFKKLQQVSAQPALAIPGVRP